MTCVALVHAQVDFAPPLDYKEPEPQPGQPALAAGSAASEGGASAGAGVPEPAAVEPEVPTFMAFAGTGQRLDGKPVSESAPRAVPIPIPGPRRPLPPGPPSTSSDGGPGSAPGSVKSSSAPKRPGKVMYGNRLQQKLAEKQQQQPGSGGGGSGDAQPLPAKPKQEEQRSEEGEESSKFKAFSGKGYSLKG